MRTICTLLFLISISYCQSQVISHTFYFNSGKSELRDQDKHWLDSVSTLLPPSANYSVVIKAYSDSDGPDESNQTLSQGRANTVKAVFIANKLNDRSITAIALGEKDPVADNSTKSGKAKNRRAEVRISYQASQTIDTVQKTEDKTEKNKTEDDLPAKKEIIIPNGLSSEKLEVGKTLILKNLNFEGGSPVLLVESESALKELLKIMKDNPTLEIEIGGHVCCGPDFELSVLRAKKVFTYLKNYGINEKRMKYKGYSFDKPIAPETTEEGKRLNRRVEITILKM
jgi:outer membrane protein OmpA-like peptidoglycan-associated protein